ncbi:hypothetical protein RI543_000801 [Arxiozyma heterogenica]|uniref:Uncharacterized protein n=1 Tax=Arxiozyma heterogenica TaxID=278026 RepID=A0AAN7ZT45_9SACH|nr:hypothetical protein RI543_000801 [Kazachstania heterogenica]
MFVRIHSQSWAQSLSCSKSFASTLGVTSGLCISRFPIRTSYKYTVKQLPNTETINKLKIVILQNIFNIITRKPIIPNAKGITSYTSAEYLTRRNRINLLLEKFLYVQMGGKTDNETNNIDDLKVAKHTVIQNQL